MNNIEYEILSIPRGIKVYDEANNEISINDYIDLENINVKCVGEALNNFYIETLVANQTIFFNLNSGDDEYIDLYYTKQNDIFADWTKMNTSILVEEPNTRVYFKGNLKKALPDNIEASKTGFNVYVTNCEHGGVDNRKVNVGGRLISLINLGNEDNGIPIPKNVFKNFFTTNGCKMCVVDASNLIFPNGDAGENSYSSMFSGATELLNPPQTLPAKNVGKKGYYRMFYNCKNIVSTPNISASKILESGCTEMFNQCKAIMVAPELPATTLGAQCYMNMFQGCTGLITAPSVLPATTLADYCYSRMFSGCTSLTTAPELPATTLANNCYYFMFYNCSGLTSAPSVLPATTLEQSCYEYMFYGCTSLTSAPELSATTLAQSCCHYMFFNCSGLTSAPSVLPATKLAQSCYEYMFGGCISLTTAPELPARTLASNCYSNMFYHCASLSSIKCLAIFKPPYSSIDYTKNWVNGVPSSGTFTKAADMDNWIRGDDGIPTGWNTEDA